MGEDEVLTEEEYCIHCKDPINKAKVVDESKNVYHVYCYNLITTYDEDNNEEE